LEHLSNFRHSDLLRANTPNQPDVTANLVTVTSFYIQIKLGFNGIAYNAAKQLSVPRRYHKCVTESMSTAASPAQHQFNDVAACKRLPEIGLRLSTTDE
jgi:Na+-transporting NADH:ubiquinone oxidoreductase subunit NqrD